MANQTINNFDFRHDKVYLSINESTAIRYSISNEYGSELLTRCLFLYNLLQKNDYQEKIDMSMLKVDINDIMNKKYTKILLKIKNVAPEYLETEREEDIVEKIKEMNFLKETDELLYYALSQQCNFKLKTPINFQELEVYKILVEYDTKNGQTYKLEDYFD